MCKTIQHLPGFRIAEDNFPQPAPVQGSIRQQNFVSKILYGSSLHRMSGEHNFSGDGICIHQKCSLLDKQCGNSAFSGCYASG
ncbi:hypothetical protein D3C81_2144750 [compost metagenome]